VTGQDDRKTGIPSGVPTQGDSVRMGLTEDAKFARLLDPAYMQRLQKVADESRMHGELFATAGFVLREAAGLDLEGEHGKRTPYRFVKMLQELTTPEEFEFTVFDNNGIDEMIIIRDIPYVSVCQHHVIPFHGLAHVAYIPSKKIAGLSKFARTVKYFAKRLQVQEQLTNQVASFLEEKLEPAGVAVVIDGHHLCMTIRGVQAPGAQTRTAEMRGVFSDHTKTAKQEFLSSINGKGQ
jgi:GTP cyclohydrolase IA